MPIAVDSICIIYAGLAVIMIPKTCSMGKARAASRIACLHANVPNMIGQITAILAKDNANVQRMTNESAGENAYTMFDTDEHLDSSTIEALKQIPSMYRVRVIK